MSEPQPDHRNPEVEEKNKKDTSKPEFPTNPPTKK